jgi:flagellar assembly protein FliH
LLEEVGKSLSHKSKDTAKDIVLYKMPLLEEKVKNASDEQNKLFLNQNVETIEREAYERGFEAGEKAGFSLGEQKALVLVEKLVTIIGELTSLRETLIKELEPQIVELALSIARKIILKELTTNPDEIVEITKEALTKLGRAGQITIKINPFLYDLFMTHKPELLDIHPDLVFDVDPAVSQNGSVVIGPVEEVVTDVDEQLKHLIREMGDKLVRD